MVYLDLVLVGFGHVGRRFAQLLQEKSVRLRGDHGVSWRVIGIATGRHGAAFDARGIDLTRALRLVESGSGLGALTGAESGRMLPPEASGLHLIRHATGEASARGLSHLVVIETTPLDIERGQPATDHVITALRGGAHVVTANKGPVAFAYREIEPVAQLARRHFLFEGSVMDGIPVFNLVRETLPLVDISGFRGVINTTTNFALAAMESGRSMDEAIAEMQAAGIAEADPSFDIDGWDAAAKTAALANVLMRAATTPHAVDRTGIRHLTPEIMLEARGRGKRLRLVASAVKQDGIITTRVAPMELDPGDPLAALTGMQNLLILDTDLLGPIGIHQLDGGLTQTAYALLSDMITLVRRIGLQEGAAR
jgi:homoserine dehydrogenase